ncbi:AAA family ATPase [uncultured Microbacterium sp.]|uniref:AAA family ATPase n=1 Tax=uncultured Microbacterium sp. TaxID=191216 RepID=UPI0028E5D49D|nr:AAA family ATPase [uncultured Microbacterium sp.]
MKPSSVDIALSLAAVGWYVFPCSVEGKPLVRWSEEATTDPATIKKAFRRGERVGVHCGRSGLLVVDIDRKDGRDGFESLEQARRRLRRTFKYASRSGKGRHYVYAAPAGVDCTIATDVHGMPGVDIRAGVGMVIYNGPELNEAPTLAPSPKWAVVHRKERGYESLVSLEEWLADEYKPEPTYKSRHLAEAVPLEGVGDSDLLPLVTPIVSSLKRRYGRRRTFEIARERYTRNYPDYGDAFDQAWTKAIARVEHDWKEPSARIATDDEREGKSATQGKGRKLSLLDLNDVDEEPIYWVIQDLIPLGTLTILSGTADVGKSTLLAAWVTQIMSGTAEGDLGGPATVLTAIGEDDLGRVLKPRMKAAGADLTSGRLQVISITYDGRDTALQLRDDLGSIRQAVLDTDARVLVLDPIISYVEGDPNATKDVRAALDPIRDLATDLNIAIIAVHHHKKGIGNAAEKLSGSHAWRDASRSHILVVKDEDTGVRFATVEKGNYTGKRLSFSFETEGVTYQNARGQDIKTARVINLQRSTTTAHDLLAKAAEMTGTSSELMQGIVHYVSSQRVSVTTSEVSEALGEDPKKVKVYLNRAYLKGQIAKAARGTYHSLAGVDISAERAKRAKK